MSTKRQTYRRPKRLTAAQRAGEERIPLSGGCFYYAAIGADGRMITDPNHPDVEIWRVGEDGRDVTWVSQAILAEWLGVTTRWVRLLEAKGLPSRGYRDTCEYPIPHALVWYTEYQVRQVRQEAMRTGAPVKSLSIAEAWAEHERRNALEEAESAYRLAVDPKYRARIEALSAEG